MSEPFSPLPDPNSRWRSFLASWGVQTLAVLFVLNLNLIYPQAFVSPARYMITNLVPYQPPVLQQPQPVNPRLTPRTVPPKVEETRVEERVEVPPLPKPRKPEAEVKAPDLKNAAVRMPELPRGRALPRVVATNVFSTGSSVMPTTNRPADKVQTGGFGDPNGVPARDTQGRPTNINAAGSWNLPAGPGRGNGTGGARGAPGVVASAGFGNGIAIGGPRKGGGDGREVRMAGFGDARPPAEPPRRQAVANGPPTTPVEILQKPKPSYTEEGRKLKIEGEVRLEVVFTASGQVQVLRVLQGLGHGLDEQAVRAAEQIKFKPAQRQGRAVDSSATLRIIFQLA